MLAAYFDRLNKGLDELPSWRQSLVALALMACLGVIGGYVWLMPLGHFLQSVVVLLVAWLVLGRWRWGFLCFLLAAGSIWIAVAEHRIGAAMVVIAIAALTAMLTFIPKADDEGDATP